MRHDELERRLLGFVNETLIGPEFRIEVDEETPLFEEGVVNSLRILDLIAFVEAETRRKVPDTEVRLANFRSIRAIAAAFGGDEQGTGDEEERPTIRIFERRRFGPSSPIAALEARHELTLEPPGRAVLRGAPRRLLAYFDSAARRWARDLGALERRYPDRLPAQVLSRAGCPGEWECPGDVVPPAVCYHVYGERERELAVPVLLTARGRCFRDEPGREVTLERLRSFQMREIVALGSREEVERFRQELIARVADLVTDLDLEGRIETASDPFFVTSANESPSADSELRGRRLMQQVLPLKYELRLALDRVGRTCAVASFNHHLDFFGRRFGLRLPSGAAAHSGCVAFGLERWVLAFLSQHGTDERRWPAPVRDFCAQKEKHARIA